MWMLKLSLLSVVLFSIACSGTFDNKSPTAIETWNIPEAKQNCIEYTCLAVSKECPDGQSCTASVLYVREDEISGFKYEEGYRYRLVIRVMKNETTSPRENSDRYYLVGVIEKTLMLAEAN